MAATPLLLLTPIDHCKTYPFMYMNIFINYIYIYIHSNILSWNIIEKTHLATWGLEPASLVSVDRHVMVGNHYSNFLRMKFFLCQFYEFLKM